VVFTGKPAPPRLARTGERLFRTRIREAAANGPNFAGHYTIAKWGCGSACVSGVVVDAQTGKIHSMPFSILGFGFALKSADGASWVDYSFRPLEFRVNSRLLIVRGCPEDDNCGAYYYEWTGFGFRLLCTFSASPVPAP